MRRCLVRLRSMQPSTTRLDLNLAHFFSQQFLEELDVLLLLRFDIAPEMLDGIAIFRIGNLLVITRQGVDPPTQFMDQIVVGTGARLFQIGTFFFYGE